MSDGSRGAQLTIAHTAFVRVVKPALASLLLALVCATPVAADPGDDGASEASTPTHDAIVFVVDKSGSMDGRLAALENALAAAIDSLDDDDLVGVLAFDSTPMPIVRIQAAPDARAALGRIRAGGGTDIEPALLFAYHAIDMIDARRKRIVLMSDGQSAYGQLPNLADEAGRRNIQIHTVALGESVDRDLLAVIASKSGGDAVVLEDTSGLEDTFVSSVRELVDEEADE